MPTVSRLSKVKPILAKPLREPFDDTEWSFEFKYDGFRGLLYIEKGSACIVSRNGKVLSRFEPLAKKIADHLQLKDGIFDGEVIAPDATGRPIFINLLRNIRPFRYIAFDMLWLNGKDLRALPLMERRKFLRHIVTNKPPAFLARPIFVKKRGKELFRLMCAHDLEGVVAKKLNDPYSEHIKWYKIKNPEYSQLIDRQKFFKKKE